MGTVFCNFHIFLYLCIKHSEGNLLYKIQYKKKIIVSILYFNIIAKFIQKFIFIFILEMLNIDIIHRKLFTVKNLIINQLIVRIIFHMKSIRFMIFYNKKGKTINLSRFRSENDFNVSNRFWRAWCLKRKSLLRRRLYSRRKKLDEKFTTDGV